MFVTFVLHFHTLLREIVMLFFPAPQKGLYTLPSQCFKLLGHNMLVNINLGQCTFAQKFKSPHHNLLLFH